MQNIPQTTMDESVNEVMTTVNILIRIHLSSLKKNMDCSKQKQILRIEMENYHIIMTMGMYRIEPPWIMVCLIQTY
jgi:hypothetical protein